MTKREALINAEAILVRASIATDVANKLLMKYGKEHDSRTAVFAAQDALYRAIQLLRA